MKILLALFMFMVMPFTGIAHEFSFDNVSKKYPIDSEYFAFNASQELSKKYSKELPNIILIPAKDKKFTEALEVFLIRSGFTINGNTDGLVMSYTFDFLDKNRAYLRLELSDGNHIGVVRKLGENTPFSAPTTKVSEEIISETPINVEQINAVQETLTEIQKSPLLATPIKTTPTYWILKQGSLMNQLDEWAKKESWKVIWQANYDLDLNAEASFSGDFINVVEQVFNALPKKNNGLRINIYKANRVIEVIGE